MHAEFMPNVSQPKAISLLPREHGAYAQLGVALAAGLALVAASPRAWAQALATALAFLASEPFLVLWGRRGEVAKRQGFRAAGRRLALCLALLLPALGLAWAGAAQQQIISVLPGLGFGLALLGLFLVRREHSLPGELLAAGAFSFAALPVAILGGANQNRAWVLALGLTALHGLGTTLVRGVLSSLKQGSARAPRGVAVFLGLALIGGVLAAPLPKILAWAPVPLAATALWVFAAPPFPRNLRTVGWILTLGSALGALVLLIGLHGFPA